MSAKAFVDTNVLYYALTDSPDPRHARARERVEALWAAPGTAAVSVQVLQELHVNLVRKAGLSTEASAQRVESYLAWHVIDNDRALLRAAFDVQRRWQFSFWDSLIVAAAHRSGADALWTEDLPSGQSLDGVKVVNPFGDVEAD
jgi:predicted nucleic acid-binding protein